MIEEIRIARVATYGDRQQKLDGLRQVNFVFGTNGTGKTTISRVIANAAEYPTCGLDWRSGRPMEPLVYNSDFVDRNFTGQMKGIFTLGEANAETLAKIEAASAKVGEIEGQIAQLKNTLGAEDDSSGKRGELAKLRGEFEDECWKIKTTHDNHFKGAFDSVRAAKAKFCDRVLQEAAGNTADLHGIDDLKSRASTVYADGAQPIPKLQTYDAEPLLALEQEAVLQKKVIGKEDVDVAALIRRLNNSDWVRQGLRYAEGPGQPCPFCQQAVSAELLEDLQGFFDEAYIADLADIERLEAAYEQYATDALRVADGALHSGNPHIDPDHLRPLVDRLKSVLMLNKRHIERKRKEPSSPVSLEPVHEPLGAVEAVIGKANEEIGRHNALVANIKSERLSLTDQIWKALTNDSKEPIDAYIGAKRNLDNAVRGITSNIERKAAELAEAKRVLAELEKDVTSVQPTVTEINAILTSFGFTTFKLATAGDKEQYYEIVRSDGTSARDTLSEGERSFITFLYFYQLVQGSTTASGVTTDRIVVFDDPVSSLDSDVLFIVSALIKRVVAEAKSGRARVKQVFVLTHNIYFHKEVTFDGNRSGADRFNTETFWTVRRIEDMSSVQGHETNPIKTSYELLWEEVRNPNRSPLTIQNVLRRILEHYFTILGNLKKDEVIEMFDGRDKVICASLYSWVNEGSHHFADDLYVVADAETASRYLAVFKEIFVKTNHEAHYRMMMRGEDIPPPPDNLPEVIEQAAELAVELLAAQGLQADGEEPLLAPAPSAAQSLDESDA